MGIPQIIYIVLSAIGLLLAAYYHGKPRDNYNFWTVLVSSFIAYGLLIWGGFFK